jgi:hypothetical protein
MRKEKEIATLRRQEEEHQRLMNKLDRMAFLSDKRMDYAGYLRWLNLHIANMVRKCRTLRNG